jgi:hypothetical protein
MEDLHLYLGENLNFKNLYVINLSKHLYFRYLIRKNIYLNNTKNIMQFNGIVFLVLFLVDVI